MDDIELKLTFEDAETAVAFARAIEQADLSDQPFRIATFDPRLNFDGEHLLFVIKVVGASAKALAAFLTLCQVIMKGQKKPSVAVETNEKKAKLEAKANEEDVRKLSDSLLPPQQ